MNDKVFDTIQKFNMLSKGDVVVVGVSGGADSMALLHYFYEIKDKLEFKIVAAHVNHMLRGQESDRDEIFVKNWCDDNDIPIKILKIDIKKIASEKGLGLEECGRNIRYEFFRKIEKEYCQQDSKRFLIATAHTLSDSMETVLMNIARGSRLKGLCGIAPVRDNIIRPLIFVDRASIENYCKQNCVPYIIDSSNLKRDYTRNKIRLDMIPLMRAFNPSIELAFMRMINSLMDDEEYLNKIANDALENVKIKLGYDVKRISELDKPIRSRVIMKATFNECGVYLESTHLELIFKALILGNGKVTIQKGFYVKIKNGVLSFETNQKKIEDWEFNFSEGEFLITQGKKIKIKIVNYKEFVNMYKKSKNLFYNALNYDTIENATLIRNRREKDFFHPLNKPFTKKLKKLFNELKIPVDKRNDLAVLVNGNEVLWIEDIGVSEIAKLKNFKSFPESKLPYDYINEENSHLKKIVVITKEEF